MLGQVALCYCFNNRNKTIIVNSTILLRTVLRGKNGSSRLYLSVLSDDHTYIYTVRLKVLFKYLKSVI